MRVLYLGPTSRLVPFLAEHDEVRQDVKPISADVAADFLVSYGYEHIIGGELLALFPRRAVNLHISYLPWNRGSHPNLWSFIEGTPNGVSLHYLDEGIDTGPVIAQRKMNFEPSETVRTSYAKLKRAVEELFMEHWPEIRAGTCDARPQIGTGSYHTASDARAIEHLLTVGWDTEVGALMRRQSAPGLRAVGEADLRFQRVDPLRAPERP